jgi:Uncharacterized conserved protein (DUF2190)
VPTYPVNECIPYYNPADDVTAYCTAAVTGKRFVDISAGLSSEGLISVAPASAKGKSVGVAARDQAAEKRVLIRRHPQIVPVTASGTIEAGEEVEVAAGGKAAKKNEGIARGRAWSKATDGLDCRVELY